MGISPKNQELNSCGLKALCTIHLPLSMTQGAIPESLQDTPADVMVPGQQSLDARPAFRALRPQREPPHCGHSATQHTPSASMPGRPLLHVSSGGSRSKEVDQRKGKKVAAYK